MNQKNLQPPQARRSNFVHQVTPRRPEQQTKPASQHVMYKLTCAAPLSGSKEGTSCRYSLNVAEGLLPWGREVLQRHINARHPALPAEPALPTPGGENSESTPPGNPPTGNLES